MAGFGRVRPSPQTKSTRHGCLDPGVADGLEPATTGITIRDFQLSYSTIAADTVVVRRGVRIYQS